HVPFVEFDQEEKDLRVFVEVTKRHILLIARKIRIAERLFVQNLQEPARSAAMLDIGPPGGIRRPHIEVIARGDEAGEIGGESGLPGHEAALLLRRWCRAGSTYGPRRLPAPPLNPVAFARPSTI